MPKKGKEGAVAEKKVPKCALNEKRELMLHGTLRYQACDDRVCYIPATVPLQWTFRFEPLDRVRAPAELQRKAKR